MSKPTKSHVCDPALAEVHSAVGTIEVFRSISNRFHHKIERDTLLRPFFPKDMSALEERLALFMWERTGGGSEYTGARGKTSLFCRHAHLKIGPKQAERWIHHMAQSLTEEGVNSETSTRVMANLTEIAHGLSDPFVDIYDMLSIIRRGRPVCLP